MTLIKDTLEKLAPAISPSASQASAGTKPDPGGLRSDAVSLEVPVKVHGSRVTQVAGDAVPHTEPFEEQTSTMIVFPQGGVLKMSTAVSVGQMVVVTNLKSGQDSICRVVKVRAYANTQSYVEVEFTHRQVGYWGVQFSSYPVEAPKRPVPAPLTVPRAPIVPSAAFEAHSPQTRPVPVSRTPAPQAGNTKVPSTFVKFGEQEDVQLAATPTATSRSGSAASMDLRTPAIPLIEPAKQVARPPSPSVEELRGDAQPSGQESAESDEPVLILEDSPALDRSPAPSPAPAFRAFGETTNLGGIANSASAHPAAREMFGVPLESEKAANKGRGSKTLALSVVAIVVLAVVGASGYFFLYQHSDSSTVPAVTSDNVQQSVAPGASASPVANSPQQAAQTAPSVVLQASPSRQQSPVKGAPARSAAAAAASPVARSRERAPAETQQVARNDVPASAVSSNAPVATDASATPGAAERHRASENVPSLFGALNAHPVASHSATRVDEAPSLPAADTGGLPVISQPTAGPPAPGPHVTTPPRLISSVLPVYPDFARQRSIDGAVVVQATVEANGTVGAEKVLSGPLLLRTAALQAVRQWKYEPGKVDGQNAPVDVNVTLRFNAK